MKRKALITSLFLAPFLFSCSSNPLPSDSSSISSKVTYPYSLLCEVGTVSYGVEKGEKASYLLCGENNEFASFLFPEKSCRTDFSSLLPGDLFEADLLLDKPGLYHTDSMPSRYGFSKEQAEDERVTLCKIKEVEIKNGEFVGSENLDFSHLFVDFAIDSEKTLVDIPLNGTCYVTFSSKYENRVRAIFLFNPRPQGI